VPLGRKIREPSVGYSQSLLDEISVSPVTHWQSGARESSNR
jgi:hypothetical protein